MSRCILSLRGNWHGSYCSKYPSKCIFCTLCLTCTRSRSSDGTSVPGLGVSPECLLSADLLNREKEYLQLVFQQERKTCFTEWTLFQRSLGFVSGQTHLRLVEVNCGQINWTSRKPKIADGTLGCLEAVCTSCTEPRHACHTTASSLPSEW